MISTIVCGAKGRMGQNILKLLKEDKTFRLAYACDLDSPLQNGIEKGDVVIDFSTPEATLKHIELCEKHKKPIVIGTTGFTPEQKKRLEASAKKIPVILSSNMSIGVNVLWYLIAQTSQTLGQEFNVSISETHHIHKKDKPSGTAKTMSEVVEQFRTTRPEIQSIREGEVIGDHTIVFETARERLEIIHHAKTREIFAEGAITAARWILDKKPGLYDMKDVLSLVSSPHVLGGDLKP